MGIDYYPRKGFLVRVDAFPVGFKSALKAGMSPKTLNLAARSRTGAAVSAIAKLIELTGEKPAKPGLDPLWTPLEALWLALQSTPAARIELHQSFVHRAGGELTEFGWDGSQWPGYKYVWVENFDADSGMYAVFKNKPAMEKYLKSVGFGECNGAEDGDEAVLGNWEWIEVSY